MRLGAHQSIAGGLHRALEAAVRDGCEAVQIFTRNQSQWRAAPLTDERVQRFREAVHLSGLARDALLVHDSYLINLAARDRGLRRRSVRALVDELDRCARLDIPWLVMHPGAHVGQGEARGLALVADGLREALARTADAPAPTTLLLETTAGQGTSLGHRFEHLRDLLGSVEPRGRLGVCVDTQHIWAAGYDLVSESGYRETFRTMRRVFGLDVVRAFHLNDSRRERGCRVDRHERIGEGTLGRVAFHRLVNDRRFAHHPAVLELAPPYAAQLRRLRRWSDGRATKRRRPRAPRGKAALAGLRAGGVYGCGTFDERSKRGEAR